MSVEDTMYGLAEKIRRAEYEKHQQYMREKLIEGMAPMSASEARAMQQAQPNFSSMPEHVADAWRYAIGAGMLTGKDDARKRTGPDVYDELLEDVEPVVDTPTDAFAVKVAVVAELEKAGAHICKIAKQVVEAVQARRNIATMGARDLLRVCVAYQDIGMRVHVTTNATLSKAVVEVVDTDELPKGSLVSIKEFKNYEQFEAYKAPV